MLKAFFWSKKICQKNLATKAITLFFFCLQKKKTVIKLYRKRELKKRGDDKKERGNKNQRSEIYQTIFVWYPPKESFLDSSKGPIG